MLEAEEDRIIVLVNNLTMLTTSHDFDLLDKVEFVRGATEQDIFAIGNKLVELGYAELEGPFHVKITDLFREVNYAGGHFEYLKQVEKQRKEDIKYNAEVNSLHSTHKNNIWFYKTRWVPHILSGVAFIISVIALIYAIMTYYST